MTIICSGSLAFDRLAAYKGLFKDLILPEKLDILNICFLVDNVERRFGGTVGNIAYNLVLLGEKPLVISSLGNDSDGRDYLSRLKSFNITLEGIRFDPENATAGAYIATDNAYNQLIFFNPGAMQGATLYNLRNLANNPQEKLAIVSPGGFSDMLTLSKAYREMGIRFICDPGQQIPVFSATELLEMLQGSLILMTNEYELDLFLKKTSLTIEQLFRYTGTVITTFGESGSQVITPKGSQRIPPVEVKKAINPTGAGDAYRAGVLKAIHQGQDLFTACRLGSVVAAFCVEAPGTQEHNFSLNEILERYATVYKGSINLE
ncbi:MAG: carbohydrate kinase family protein [Deltaproteobacteria bacterium]|jgi:adenosine kinase|nr:carbohydrate kinase family protein [Deltaproteobacteria bacterium]